MAQVGHHGLPRSQNLRNLRIIQSVRSAPLALGRVRVSRTSFSFYPCPLKLSRPEVKLLKPTPGI
jgi:hypothetical protein